MDPKFYKEYYHLERNHWWFTARLKILESCVRNLDITAGNKPLNILNAGVATGATSEMLNQFGNVTSLEYDEDCCDFLEAKTSIRPIRGSLTELPFQDCQFDLVCAFDVIEHIENDTLACKEIARVLSDEGNYVVTVPAYNFLWSRHDVINHHFRRYNKKSFLKTLLSGQLHNTQATYFNFLLFLPIASYRIIQKLLPQKGYTKTSGSDNEIFEDSTYVSKLLHSIFLLENKVLNRNIRLPFGISLISIGKKGK